MLALTLMTLANLALLRHHLSQSADTCSALMSVKGPSIQSGRWCVTSPHIVHNWR